MNTILSPNRFLHDSVERIRKREDSSMRRRASGMNRTRLGSVDTGSTSGLWLGCSSWVGSGWA
jgi:hypothetical protein